MPHHLSCDTLSRPVLNETYPERVAYRIIWRNWRLTRCTYSFSSDVWFWTRCGWVWFNLVSALTCAMWFFSRGSPPTRRHHGAYRSYTRNYPAHMHSIRMYDVMACSAGCRAVSSPSKKPQLSRPTRPSVLHSPHQAWTSIVVDLRKSLAGFTGCSIQRARRLGLIADLRLQTQLRSTTTTNMNEIFSGTP